MTLDDWREQLQNRQRLLREQVEQVSLERLQEHEEQLPEQAERLRMELAQQQKDVTELHAQVDQLTIEQERHYDQVKACLGIKVIWRGEDNQARKLLSQLKQLQQHVKQVEQQKAEQLNQTAQLGQLVAQQRQELELLRQQQLKVRQQLSSRVPKPWWRGKRRREQLLQQVEQRLQQLEPAVEHLQQYVAQLEPKLQTQQQYLTEQQKLLLHWQRHFEELQQRMKAIHAQVRTQVSLSMSTDDDAQQRMQIRTSAMAETTAALTLVTTILEHPELLEGIGRVF